MKNCHCNQCSFDWKARVPDPRCCPACKRYDWNQPKKGATEVANEGRSNLQPKVGKRTAADTRKRRGVAHASVPDKPRSDAPNGRVEPVSNQCPLHGKSCGFAKGNGWYCSKNSRVFPLQPAL